MLAEKNEQQGAMAPTLRTRAFPWVRLLLSLILAGLGLWLVFRGESMVEVVAVLSGARLGYVLLALFVILVTGLVKSWRWQLLFTGAERIPRYSSLFWTLHLAQLVNTVMPFLRFGELVRIFDLDHREHVGKALILGTLVIEKVLELLTLVLIMVTLIPFLVVPDFVRDSGLVLALASLLAFTTLWIVAYRTSLVITLLQPLVARLPAQFRDRIMGVLVSGLGGLGALRSSRVLIWLLLSSAAVGFLYVLTPAILFRALDMEQGLVAGASIHAVLSVGTLPSWAPANVGVFEFLTAYMLRFLGESDTTRILAFTLLFHAVIIIPQVILGGIALLKGYRISNKVPAAKAAEGVGQA